MVTNLEFSQAPNTWWACVNTVAFSKWSEISSATIEWLKRRLIK